MENQTDMFQYEGHSECSKPPIPERRALAELFKLRS